MQKDCGLARLVACWLSETIDPLTGVVCTGMTVCERHSSATAGVAKQSAN